MMINMRCSQCGAELTVDDSVTTIFCKYCGSQITNTAVHSMQDVLINQTVNVVHTMDRSNEPNLYINYMSVNPAVMMVTRIAETGQKNTYIGGQTMTFKLTPGKHIVVLKIGKINYNRTIYITNDNQPVRINASFTGRANINIDQPAYSIEAETEETARPVAAVNNTPRLPKSPWSVLAFVLSFFIITSPVAVALGVLDLTIWKKKEKTHGLSIAAIAIGACMSFMLVPMFSGCSNTSSSSYSSAIYTEEVESNIDDLSNKAIGFIVGTYVGHDGSVLIFHKDGTCDYYYKTYDAMEVGNPWMFKDDYLVWYTKDMKCNIYSKIKSLNTSSLVFKSDSLLWTNERYKKISDDDKKLNKSECDDLIANNK